LIIMHDWSRLATRRLGHDERLVTKAPEELLMRLSITIGFDVPLIPRHTKRPIGNLKHEEVEFRIGWQTTRIHLHELDRAKRFHTHVCESVRQAVAGFSCGRPDHLKTGLGALFTRNGCVADCPSEGHAN